MCCDVSSISASYPGRTLCIHASGEKGGRWNPHLNPFVEYSRPFYGSAFFAWEDLPPLVDAK